MLTRLFGGSETSRLSRALVAQDKIALSATSGYGATALGLTSFEIAVQPARGRSVAEVETAVGDQMKRVLDGGVTAEEVERAQNQLLASAIYSQDSLASGPRLYGNALSTGGSIAELDNWPQAIAAVRPDDVVAAARHVWRDDGRGHVAAHAGRGLEMTVLRWLALVLGFALVASRAEAVEVKEVTTPLGLKAWLVEDSSAPVVALSFSFAGGSASDPEKQKGLTSLTASLLTDGAGPLDAQAFKRRQEDAAVSLSFGASLEYVGGSLRLLSAHRDEAFELLRLAVTAPRFDPDRFEQRRAQTIAALNQADQRPASVAQRTMMATVFAGHPYGGNASGVRENLQTLTVEQVKDRAASVLTRNGLIVARWATSTPPNCRASSIALSAACRRAPRDRRCPTGRLRPSRAPSASNGRCRRASVLIALPASRATIRTGMPRS